MGGCYIGTFSKILAPGLRVGWVIAPEPVIRMLVLAKQAADLHTSTFCQHVVHEVVATGFLERHISQLRAAYKQRLEVLLSGLAKYFPTGVAWTRPCGGMFLLVTLPARVNAAVLLQHALARKVAFVPGEEFHLNGQGANTLRLNFTNTPPDVLLEGVKRLADALIEAQRTVPTEPSG